jgi:pectate lyase
MKSNKMLKHITFTLGLVILTAFVQAEETNQSIAPDFSLLGYAVTEGGTTGGQGGKTITVSTVADFVAAAGATEPLNILVAGPLDLGSNTVKVAANKTITGVGTNAGFMGHVYMHGVSNIILRNLSFTNPRGVGQGIGGGDGMTAHSTHHVWVDHCNFDECADGQFDITHGSDFITVSWCKFSYTNEASDHRLSMLIGNQDKLAAEDTGKLHVTLHHNWIGDLVQDRAPRVRFGQVHIFNNYYGAKDINTCIGLGCGSQVLEESCDFDGMKRPWRSRSEPECTEGRIQWNDDNIYNHPKLTIEGTNSTVFKPTYPYRLDAGKSVKDIVTNNAGVGRGPFAPK